jgi:hypothetical protein
MHARARPAMSVSARYVFNSICGLIFTHLEGDVLASAALTTPIDPVDYDLKTAVTPNRLRGLWRMTTGFRLAYLVAALAQGGSRKDQCLPAPAAFHR